MICPKHVSWLAGVIRISQYFDARLAYTAARGGTRQGSRLSEAIFTGAGRYTCGGRFGSLDYEEIDAKTYAEWEIDYLSETSACFFALGSVLSCFHGQSMITVITKARVGLH